MNRPIPGEADRDAERYADFDPARLVPSAETIPDDLLPDPVSDDDQPAD